MRILVANKKDWTHPEGSGAETNLRETLPRLADRGHEVHLLAAHHPGAERHEELEGVHVHRYGRSDRTNELYILSVGQLHLNRLIRDLDPDVVYTVNSLMTWLPFFDGGHLTAIHHLSGTAVFRKLDVPYNILGYLAERLSVVLARRRYIMTVSPATTDDLVARGVPDGRITEIRNGVDTDRYRPGSEADEPTVLYLGRLEYNKGVDDLPRIHEEIRRHDDGYRLEIAGAGRREREVRRFARRHDDVRFHGYVDEETKAGLLQRAWVTIVPSRREGWGLTVSESNAAGTPAVGFDTGGLRSAIRDGETGVLVPTELDRAAAIDSFGRAVADLLADTDRRREMGEAARSFAESLDWERTTDRLETLLHEVADGGTDGPRS